MFSLRVSSDEALARLNSVNHKQFKRVIPNWWHVSEDGTVSTPSVCWLFCWGKASPTLPNTARAAREIFNEILYISFETFDTHVPHDWARWARYASQDIQSELRGFLNFTADSTANSNVSSNLSYERVGPVYKLSNVPLVDEYIKGLTAIANRINEIQFNILAQQYSAPNREVSSSELAELANITGGHSTVNLLYGRLGRMFCNETGLIPDLRPNDTYRWWSVWSMGYETRSGQFRWVMLPEVAEALEQLNWVHPNVIQSPEEVTRPERFTEGAVTRITVNAYERNRKARQACIDHYGTRCMVCGFDFFGTYGHVGKGVIH